MASLPAKSDPNPAPPAMVTPNRRKSVRGTGAPIDALALLTQNAGCGGPRKRTGSRKDPTGQKDAPYSGRKKPKPKTTITSPAPPPPSTPRRGGRRSPVITPDAKMSAPGNLEPDAVGDEDTEMATDPSSEATTDQDAKMREQDTNGDNDTEPPSKGNEDGPVDNNDDRTNEGRRNTRETDAAETPSDGAEVDGVQEGRHLAGGRRTKTNPASSASVRSESTTKRHNGDRQKKGKQPHKHSYPTPTRVPLATSPAST